MISAAPCRCGGCVVSIVTVGKVRGGGTAAGQLLAGEEEHV